MSSAAFHSELFSNPEQYEEVPLRDCKAQLDLNHEVGKAELIRDVIALANTARLLGEPAYLLIGLRNAPREVIDISPMFDPTTAVDDVHRWEALRHSIHDLIARYITPLLANWHLRHGTIDGCQVGYIEIAPTTNSEPFTVKRDFRSSLSKGQCWIRIGESKHEVAPREIAPEEDPFRYAYSEVPYVLPSRWSAYFDRLSNRSGTWQAVAPYQPLSDETGSPLDATLERFLMSDQQVLVIQAAAGGGKSVYLRKVAHQAALDGLVAAEQAVLSGSYEPPSTRLPLLVELRGLQVANASALEAYLLDVLNAGQLFWDQRPTHPERLFNHRQLRWLVLLDGLDEIWQSHDRERFIGALGGFVTEHQSVKVVLTSRANLTGIRQPSWNASVITIAPLTRVQIENYILAQTEEVREAEFLLHQLEGNDDLWSLCGIPRYLTAAVGEFVAGHTPVPEVRSANEMVQPAAPEPIVLTASDPDALAAVVPVASIDDLAPIEQDASEQIVADAETDEPQNPIRLAVLLDRVYRRVWDIEMERYPAMKHDVLNWWDSTAELAIDMDGHRKACRLSDANHHFQSQEAVPWLLSQGVLNHTKHGWLSFLTLLTQYYFAATFIAACVDAEDRDMVRATLERTTEKFKLSLEHLVNELVPDFSSFLNGSKQT